MARVLLVALAWCAVRSEEYGGGAMPQYGGAPSDYERAPADEYRGHSPDAPAHLDYKYEEEPQGETEKPHKYVEDVVRWRKPARIQRRPTRDDAKEEVELQAFNGDTDMGPISRHGRSRRKNRGRRDRARRDEEPPLRRRTSRYSRPKHDEDLPNYLDTTDYRDDNDLERDDLTSVKETTVRIIRRKPRDRVFAPPPPPKNQDIIREQTMDHNDQLISDRRSNEKFDDLEYASGAENDEFNLRKRPLSREPEIEIENFTKLRDIEPKHITYRDYTDYGMRKFNIKSEIPISPRRTTTSLRRLLVRTSPMDLVRAVWPARRAGAGDDLTLDDLTVSPLPTVSASAPTTVTISSTTTITPASNYTTELSLAEKSRLSILKKAKLKERVKDMATKKPPVLLRVTSRLPTVVMVEPPTSADPWLRAREVAGDSPETLDKVKRLMRQKLVAGAKNIRDLTDNWDDTVCDYIDVSMLENAAYPRASLSRSLDIYLLVLPIMSLLRARCVYAITPVYMFVMLA